MDQDTSVVLLGLGEEFRCLSAIEQDGTLVVLVETTATVVACRACGVIAKPKDRRTVLVQDLEWGDRPGVLAWKKRVWCCKEELCPAKTWTETSDAIGVRAALTERARADVCAQVANGSPVAVQARRFGVGWETAMNAVRDHGQPLVDDPGRIGEVDALGIDETSMAKATPDAPTRYVTGLVNARTGQLIEVLDGHDGATVRDWLAAQDPAWVGAIGVVTIDLSDTYAAGCRPHLDHATLVADPFHVAQLGGKALDGIRRRVQQRDLGHRGRKDDPLYKIRKILRCRADGLDARGWARMWGVLNSSADARDELTEAWQVYQHLLGVYDAVGVKEGALRLDAVIAEAAGTGIDELVTLAKTLTKWRARILARHATGASNGRAEATNLQIKNTKRIGRGFSNFENYRLRLLLSHGMKPADKLRPPAAKPLRAKGPRRKAA